MRSISQPAPPPPPPESVEMVFRRRRTAIYLARRRRLSLPPLLHPDLVRLLSAILWALLRRILAERTSGSIDRFIRTWGPLATARARLRFVYVLFPELTMPSQQPPEQAEC